MSTLMNFSEMGLTVKNSTTVKNKAKESLEAFLIKALREYYGEENVSEVFKDGNNMKGKALSVGMGIVQDDGFDIEVCVNVELTAKSIAETTRKTSSGISTTPIYDRLTEADLYASETERKQQEKEEKKIKANEKKQKDKEKREKNKAQSEASKVEVKNTEDIKLKEETVEKETIEEEISEDISLTPIEATTEIETKEDETLEDII